MEHTHRFLCNSAVLVNWVSFPSSLVYKLVENPTSGRYSRRRCATSSGLLLSAHAPLSAHGSHAIPRQPCLSQRFRSS